MMGQTVVTVANTSAPPFAAGLVKERREAVETLLVQRLHQLHEAERLLATELDDLFRQTRSIPLRLALSDQRRETFLQTRRLERSIAITTGTVAFGVGTPPALRALVPSPRSDDSIETPESSIITFPLVAARAAATAYRAAILLAKDLGQISIVALLAASMREKLRTVATLVRVTKQVI